MKVKINRSFLRSLADEKPDRDQVISDSELPGFAIRISPNSKPCFVFQYRRGAKVHRMRIGTPSEFTPEEAREIARAHRVELLKGDDPRANIQKNKTRVTMRELFERYMREHAIPNKKPRPAKEDRRLWTQNVLPFFADRAVDSITRGEMITLKARLHERSKSAANATIAVLSKAFALSELWGIRPQNSNPCYKVGKFKLNKRNPLIEADDLARLGAALKSFETVCPAVVNLVRVLIFTGARKNEIMDARFDQYRKDLGVLELIDSKTGPDILQLSAEAIKVIESIDRRDGSPWLIPGLVPGEKLKNPYKYWHQIRDAADLPGLRLHDLRHIFGSYSHRSGASQHMVGSLLRHDSAESTERYIHPFISERRAASDAAAAMISERLNPRSSLEE